MKGTLLGLVAIAAILPACNRGLHSDQAVREAIEAHLKTRSDLAMTKMSLELDSVKFAGDTAEAEVKYRSKDNPNVAVSVRYTLRRAGDHWEVLSSSSGNPMATSPHSGGAMAAPPGPTAAPAPAPSH